MTTTIPHDTTPDGAFRSAARVYYEETDAGGVVYYANYLRFAERGRTEWLRAMGISHAELLAAHNLLFVVRRAAVDYRAPARLDDLLALETFIVGCGAATLDMRQIIRQDEPGDSVRSESKGTVLAVVDVKLASITPEGKIIRLPPALRAALEGKRSV